MPKSLDASLALRAFAELDRRAPDPVRLVVGGGTAMILAHGHPVATTDVDAFAVGTTLDALEKYTSEIAKELDLASDWLNPWFTTFTYVLPSDYASRLQRVFEGEKLTVDALGAEDLLVMKCFAGRDKDRPHAIRLLKKANDLDLVDRHLSALAEQRIPGADKAADFFDDLRERLGL
jgi:predicted nucleotidyltransferase